MWDSTKDSRRLVIPSREQGFQSGRPPRALAAKFIAQKAHPNASPLTRTSPVVGTQRVGAFIIKLHHPDGDWGGRVTVRLTAPPNKHLEEEMQSDSADVTHGAALKLSDTDGQDMPK